MSQLQKAISRIQRREGPRLGFGQGVREQPRAMLAAAIANDSGGAEFLAAAGADVVLVASADPAAFAAAPKGTAVGALLPGLDEPEATRLRGAGCDFVVSPLDRTSAAALDADAMGQVAHISNDISDTTLRALGPVGLDALYFEATAAEMSLAAQLEYVRLSSFSSTPLIVAVPGVPSVSALRVYRDSGVAAVVLPAGASADDLEALVANLKAVPPPRKPRREAGGEFALVPSRAAEAAGGGDDEDDEDDD